MSQYLSDQSTSFQRYSWSWGWVYRGFVTDWRYIVRLCCPDYKLAVSSWESHLKGFVVKIGDNTIRPFPYTVLVDSEQIPLEVDTDNYSFSEYWLDIFKRGGLIE